jgi:hypothetical protein
VFVEYALMLRTIVCCAALVLALGQNAVAAPACDDTECQAATTSKPLNIMQFMREQAASTRPPKPRQARVQPVAHAQRPAHRVVAARPKPAAMPVEAASSYASQEPKVQIVASDELNDIDRAAVATLPSAETTGGAIAAESNVQLVDTEAFNDIDRKAEGSQQLSAAARIADAHAASSQGGVSWLQWIWSAVGGTFAALATAVHQLIGL